MNNMTNKKLLRKIIHNPETQKQLLLLLINKQDKLTKGETITHNGKQYRITARPVKTK